LRVVFMGTPGFAVPVLAALRAEHDVVSVYSRPDRPHGRGRKLVPTPVKQAALAAGLTVRQPERLGGCDEAALLEADHPDVIVVAAFGAILPPAVLAVPVHGCINVHASLLPRWRGAAPIQRAILAGDAVTGVSIMRMEEGLDTGPWCAQQAVDVDEKDAAHLELELAAVGAFLLSGVLAHLGDGSLVWHDQDGSQATYAAKLTPADVALEPSLTVSEALARVRAAGPSAPCRVRVGQTNLTVVAATSAPGSLAPGVARCADDLDLGCADGALRLEVVVPEGRAAMSGRSYLRGARTAGDCDWSAR
jgi:methionyl-tRNA formyltransferase